MEAGGPAEGVSPLPCANKSCAIQGDTPMQMYLLLLLSTARSKWPQITTADADTYDDDETYNLIATPY